MRFLNKKSLSMLSTLFYLLFGLMLAAFFIFGVFFKVKAALDDSSYHKKFYSRDLALLVDSLHASNGRFVITYETNLPEKMKLDFALDPDQVFVTDRSNIPLEKRAQTFFRFGYNTYVKVIPERINRTLFEFHVVYDNKTIMFKFPKKDVKLEESGEE